MVGEKKPSIKSLSLDILTLKEEVKQIEPLKQKVSDLMKIIKDLKIRRSKVEENVKKEKQQGVLKCKICEQAFESIKKLKKHLKEMHPKRIACSKCDKEFVKNSDLETHVINEHAIIKKYKCDLCEKMFVLEWRLLKHRTNHMNQNRKRCHYFNNGKQCPYDEIGCMFAHEMSKMCIFDKMCNNKLCSYQHSATKAQNHAFKNISSGDFDDDMEEIEFGMKETKSFKASTPNKTNSECEDCDDQAECVECIVKRVRRRHGDKITASCTPTFQCMDLESSSSSASGCSGGASSNFS